MPVNVVANTCRLTVLTRTTRVDLVVPVDVSVADLLATLVSGLGTAVADEGIDRGGWVLQRVGDQPLDPARSLAVQDILDGAVLHLLPRARQLPELAFDDVLDAVGTGIRERTRRWTETSTRITYLILGATALLACLVVTLLSGPPWTVPTVLLGAVAFLLLLAATGFARSVGAIRSAVLTGTAAVVFAAAAGGCALGRGQLVDFGAVQALPAAAAAILVASLALILIGRGAPVFVTVLGAGLLAVIGTGAADATDLNARGCAAAVAIAALALSPFLPVLAFRASRLILPGIVSTADDLRTDTATIDGAAVLDQAARADEYLTGLTGGVSMAIGGSAVILALSDDVSAQFLAGVLGAVLLLRARLFTGLGQRGMLLGAGTVAGLALLMSAAQERSGTERILICAVPAVAVALVLFVASTAMVGRRLAPPWGRFSDLLETTLVLAVIPLAVAVLGVYGAVRTISPK